MPSTAVEFDFEKKVDREVAFETCKEAIAGGRFVWVDVDATDLKQAADTIRATLPVSEDVVNILYDMELGVQSEFRPDYLRIVLAPCRLTGEDLFAERADVVIGNGWLLTIRRGRALFMDRVKRTYHDDFMRFAKSPSVLLYEILDAICDGYREIANGFDERVEMIQGVLMQEHVPESIFNVVSRVQSDLIKFKKYVAPFRELLFELSTRKSPFVAESTQPFLLEFRGMVERVLGDLHVNRETLSESLNLYMSVISYRTNHVMTRLTVVTVVFLPLTFLCGIYGMNFEFMPEVKWPLGYVWFWGWALLIVAGVLFVMRRMRIL
jgi:magnesium transporter